MEDRTRGVKPSSIPIYHPAPRRSGIFNLTPLTTSTDQSRTQTPSPNDIQTETPSSAGPSSADIMLDGGGSPGTITQKTRSILNLTSSTLFGIYSPTGYDANREDNTPWGTGAQTPLRDSSFALSTSQLPADRLAQISQQRRKDSVNATQMHKPRAMSENHHQRPESSTQRALGASWRVAVLFSMGLAYGEFVTRLHDTREVAPVQMPGIPRRTWGYLMFWGVVAVALGSLLPWVDRVWGARMEERAREDVLMELDGAEDSDGDRSEGASEADEKNTNNLGADWNPIVRTIGAFVGIAFAIRRLPWQSTLQVSLTLALVNPFMWYLIDRSKTGFALSAAVGISGAAALLGINPNILPSPAMPKSAQTMVVAGISYESLGVATWISSVLFCSSVCFGNLGRRLARDSSVGGR